MGSAAGAEKAAAKRIGLSLMEYQSLVARGLKWCTGCKDWHPISEFQRDAYRNSGLTAACRDYRIKLSREIYIPRPRPKPGRRFVEARNGDKLQARGRVNNLVSAGLLPKPSDLPCVDCGHVRDHPGSRKHEYDHHRGYAAEHHEDVEAVCTLCHKARERDRRG